MCIVLPALLTSVCFRGSAVAADKVIVSCSNVHTYSDGRQKTGYCLFTDGTQGWTAIKTYVIPPKSGGTTTTVLCTSDCPPVLHYGNSCQGIPDAQWGSCTGANAGPACPAGEARFDSYHVGSDGTLQLLDSFCQNPITTAVPPQYYVDQYVRNFVPNPAVGALHPGEGQPLPVTLDLFVSATSPTQQDGHVGPPGTRIVVHYDQPEYTWQFGDGHKFGPTSSAGGSYPDGDIRHPYTNARDYAVSLHVTWRVTYDYILNGVTHAGLNFARVTQGPDQTFQAHIVEAHAVLVQ